MTAVTLDAERRVIGDAGIAIEGTRIAAVAKAAELAGRYPDASRLDGHGMVAIPGLIDTHSHADQSLLRGTTDDLGWIPFLRQWIDPWLARRPLGALLAAYRLSLLEMVLGGTTTFLSPNVDPTDDLKALTGVIAEAGVRAVLARWVEPPDPDPTPDTGPAANKSLEAAIAAIRRWNGSSGGLIQMWFGLMVPRVAGDRCDPPFYRAVADAARHLGTGITYHFCSEIEDAEYYEATFGQRPAEWAERHGTLGPNVLLINGCWLSPAEISIVAATGTSVAYSPTATMKMATGVTPVPELLAAGVNVSLGTDGGANNNSHDMLQEMKSGCLVQNVTRRRTGALTAEQALELATLGGARAIGRSHDLGSLEVGKRADLVLVDLHRAGSAPANDVVSSLVYAANASHVDTVLVDGELLVREGKPLRVSPEAILREASETAARVVGTITPAHRPRWPVT
ncbi:MAG: amidohydrolase family protein [Acidimicrobiales bacterium]